MPHAFTHALHKDPTTVSCFSWFVLRRSGVTEDLSSWIKSYAHFSAVMKSNNLPNSSISQRCLDPIESRVNLVVKTLILKAV